MSKRHKRKPPLPWTRAPPHASSPIRKSSQRACSVIVVPYTHLEVAMSKQDRILPSLGGQSAPLTRDGQGRRVLFRCASCQRIWLQDGSRVAFDLSAPRL